MDVTNSLTSLVAARRLILAAQLNEAERKGKKVDRKSAQEAMEEDAAILSGEQPADSGANGRAELQLREAVVRLDDLNRRAQAPAPSAGAPAAPGAPPENAGAAAVVVTQQEEVQVSLRYASLERVEGLALRSKQVAETDRYLFSFSDGATFRIIDKWSGRSTRIWGDPHVDTDNQEGDRNGEFSDLKGSNTHTTLMLQDGTRVTFTALDNSVIERVDIYKGSQHLGGTGAASKDFNEQTGLFNSRIDGASAAGLPLGDTVYAGGDGNDWYSQSGTLVWGQTTGPVVTSRPSSVLEMTYRHSITQTANVATLVTQA